MKVIDLLNMISKGEEVPTPIRFRNDYYDFDDGDYFNQQHKRWIFNDNDISGILNDEIEIIEEDKKINYIECYFKNGEHYIEDSCFRVQPLEDLELNQNEIVIIDKINEIIDKINEMENK